MTQCQFIHKMSQEGHHPDHMRVITHLVPDSLHPGNSVWRDIFSGFRARRSLFFFMIESHPFLFALTGLVGLAIGVRVAGLMFRPVEAIRDDRIKYRVKNLLFRAVRLLPNTTVILLLPLSVHPRFAQIAAGWIDDLQFWDMPILNYPALAADAPLRLEIARRAAGRKILVALGALDRQKGFDYLSRLTVEAPILSRDFLLVAAGKVRPASKDAAQAFVAAGGYLVDRRIDDAEMRALYEIADLVWTCYAPDYNQASGIFGRAFQFGVPALTREGAYLSTVGAEIGQTYLEIPYGNPGEAAARILAWSPPRPDVHMTETRVAAMAAHAAEVFATALNTRPVAPAAIR